MALDFQQARTVGYERLCAWADLLDEINVFPVADADTGVNLKTSLAPLRQATGSNGSLAERLILNARGNSGNIAAAFFSEFLAADKSGKLATAARAGGEKARQVLADPLPGTMLTVFDALAEALAETPADQIPVRVAMLIDHLEGAVHLTRDTLPELKRASVVDAGALGMFIFLEGFFVTLCGADREFRPVTDVFRGKLKRTPCKAAGEDVHCVESVVNFNGSAREAASSLAGVGESVIVIPNREQLKVHLHTHDLRATRGSLQSLGDVVHWRQEVVAGPSVTEDRPAKSKSVHIMTDAAGSVTPADARRWNMTLLSSYITREGLSLPETLVSAEDLYGTMRRGGRVTTSQASVFERGQCCQSVLSRYRQVLYLCVGSVYTGNYDAVVSWKKDNDPEDRLRIIDTGAASGRLGVIALATAAFASQGQPFERVLRFAETAMVRSREYIFLDRLRYLVTGGRLSKTSGFFGDLLHLKPVISPMPRGVEKAGLTRSPKDQLEFALKRLSRSIKPESDGFIMLEYTDNRDWVETVRREIGHRYPAAEMVLQPLSLTSGAHMGPGSWGVAFLSDDRGASKEEEHNHENSP